MVAKKILAVCASISIAISASYLCPKASADINYSQINNNKSFNQTDSAEEYYKKALEINPKNTEALNNLGKIYLDQNDLDDAISNFRESIRLNPKNSTYYINLAEALIEKGDFEQATKDLTLALNLFPKNDSLYNFLGKAYEQQRLQAEAIKAYKKSIELNPKKTEAYANLSDLYANTGENDLALNTMKQAIETNPEYIEGKFKIAELYLSMGQNEQAIKFYKEIENTSEYSSYAIKGLAKAYFLENQNASLVSANISKEEYNSLENSLKQAINNDLKDLQLQLALLRILKITKPYSESQEYLDKILKNASSSAIDNIIKGEALLVFNRFNDAEIEFKKALNTLKEDDDILYLGDILTMDKQYKTSKEAYSVVLARDFDNIKAEKALDKIKQSENEAFSKYNVGKSLYEQNKTQQATETLLDALSINPFMPKAQLLLAQIFEKTKYYPEALDHYTAYINLIRNYTPDYKKYKKKVDSLQIKVEKLQKSCEITKKFKRA